MDTQVIETQFSVGDKALWRGKIAVEIVDYRDYMPNKRIVRMDVPVDRTQSGDYQWDVKTSELSLHTNSDDAEIAALKARIVALETERNTVKLAAQMIKSALHFGANWDMSLLPKFRVLYNAVMAMGEK